MTIGAIKDREYSSFVESPSRGAPFASREVVVANPDTNPVQVESVYHGVVSDLNSTYTPLGSGASFVGTWEDVSGYASVTILVRTDQLSAADGGRFQWSHDGVTITRETASTVPPSANGFYFSAPTQAKYFRFAYTNNGTPQGLFIAQIRYSEQLTGPNTVPMIATIKDDTSVLLTRSVQVAKDPNSIYVNERSTGVSPGNSSTVVLGAGATFTGAWEDVGGYTNISITIRSDQNSAVNGLLMEYSIDGVSVDSSDVYSIIGSSIGNQYTVGVAAKYFRIRYVNGSAPQTVFRLQTVFHTTAPKPSSIRVEDAITGENDAELQKAIITGRTPNGLYTNQSAQGIDPGNSTTTPLAANATYRGAWFKWSDSHTTMISFAKSDVPGTLFIDAAVVPNPANGVDTDIAFSTTVQVDPSVVPVSRRNTPLQSLWIRHRYVNGPAGQTSFQLGAAFTITDPGDVYLPATLFPQPTNLVGQHRSILTTTTADGTAFQDLPVDPLTANPKVTVQNIRDDIAIKPLSDSLATQIVVGTTPVRLDTTQVTNRRATLISNDGSFSAALGFSNAITFNTGSIIMKPGAVRVLPFDNNVQYWAIAQNTGGTQTTLTRQASTTSGTATGAANTLLSNNIYANITANGQTAFNSGYTAGTSNPIVSVKIGIEGNKQSGTTETVSIAQTVTGSTAGAGTVSSSSLAGGLNQLYVAFISRNSASGTVTGVTGGGRTFVAGAQNVTSGANRKLDMWYSYGTFSAGSVTANLSTSTNAHIAVYRITNADGVTPIQAVNSSTGNGTAVTGPTIAGTNKGYSLLAVAHLAASGTAAGGYTENSDETNGSGSNIDSLSTESLALVSTGSVSATYTLLSATDWAAIGVTINPASGNNPIVTLAYDVSAVVGATSSAVTFSSAIDSTTLLDVTADRVWTVSDIANVTVRSTGTNISAAAANIDYLFMEIVDTSGATTRMSVMQGGKTVT